jgi:hypothetical protein
MFAEEFLENSIECGEVAWVFEPYTATHYMFGPIAGFAEDG